MFNIIVSRMRLLELFDEGYTPSRAKHHFVEELKQQYKEKWLKMSAWRSVNPDSKYVFRLYTEYWLSKYGTINGPDSFAKAVNLVEEFNENAGERIANIRQLDDGTVIVAVVDVFMHRVHRLVPQSGQIMFVDGTGSLDRCNHQLVKFLTESPAGNLPLGFLILSKINSETIYQGIEDMKVLLPDDAFHRRGKDLGPQVIMTDDDNAEINALKRAWPMAIFIQCQWHILQVKTSHFIDVTLVYNDDY